MFESTTTDSATTQIRVSFLQCVKAGIGLSLGVALLPAIAVVIETYTKIPVASMLAVLRIIR